MPRWVRSKHVGQWLLLMLVVVVLHGSDPRYPPSQLSAPPAASNIARTACLRHSLPLCHMYAPRLQRGW